MLQRARNELADHGEAEPDDIQAPAADEGDDPAIEIEGAWEDEWFTEDAESEATENDDEMEADEDGGARSDANMGVGGDAESEPPVAPEGPYREPSSVLEEQGEAKPEAALPRANTSASYLSTVTTQGMEELNAIMAQIRELELQKQPGYDCLT